MNMTALENFSTIYRTELLKAVIAKPEDYGVRADDPIEPFVDGVAAKMLTGVARGIGGVNIYGSKAFAQTCKVLGIKCTYKAIKEFLGQP